MWTSAYKHFCKLAGFYTLGSLQAFPCVLASSQQTPASLLACYVLLSCPLCPLERKCHMESITKQNIKVLCIDPEKCMVIIKYIILHSRVDCAAFFFFARDKNSLDPAITCQGCN